MTTFTDNQWEQFNLLILDLYTQKDIFLLQSHFLEQLDKLIPHRRSFFDLCTFQQKRLIFFNPVSLNMTQEELASYYKEYQDSDYVAWSFSNNNAVVYRDSDIISPAARENAEIYRKWMQPMDAYYSMGSTIMSGQQMAGSITLFRSQSDGDFTDFELEMLRMINRHLSAHFTFMWPNGVSPNHSVDFPKIAERYGLSIRENEIANLIADGLSNIEISQRLFISENTVKKHVNTLYRKMGINSRTQFLKIAYEQMAVVVPASQK